MTAQEAAALPVYHGSDLGANYTPQGTVFKLWAPTADAVTLELYATGTEAEPGARPLGTYVLSAAGSGVWAVAVPGDLNGVYYTFTLAFGTRWDTIVDPYARAAGANGTRGMVLDLAAAAPEGWQSDARPAVCKAQNAHAHAVWECHVADFSADEHSGVPAPWRGKYLAFTLEDTTLDGGGVYPTCLNYLKTLGVSHIQLQPIFDYATVDEVRGGYNWGYDPLNYNVPEGSFATDARDGAVRVRECRAMVAALHRAGLGVVMDVVYNHTYHRHSWLERSVPGYWNRRDEKGRMTDGSGCGCDLASERAMVRKYIVDCVVYWAREYHIDGFRFDLMALLDIDTMNAIRAALDALPGGEDILIYGEPWAGGATRMQPGAHPANKGALGELSDRIGFFCDDTRDAIKGDTFLAEKPGFVNGGPYNAVRLLPALGAWRSGEGGFKPKSARQVVQYVSAHDNATLWDKLCMTAGRTNYRAPAAVQLAQNRLAAGVYLTCQGLPFMQAGEEFGRTKYGDTNSYRGPLSTNQLDWQRAWRPEFAALAQYYRGLLAIRRAWPRLSGANGEPAPFLLALPGWLVGFVVEQPDGARPELAVYYNPEPTPQEVELPGGWWRFLCDGVTAAPEPFGEVRCGTLTLPPASMVILVHL